METETRRLQRELAAALTSSDPRAALAALRADSSLPAAARAALERVDVDGFTIAALLIARLRFERLVQGSPRAARWFEEAPAECTAAFRTYHRNVPARALFPLEEARSFERWIQAGDQNWK